MAKINYIDGYLIVNTSQETIKINLCALLMSDREALKSATKYLNMEN